MDITFSCDRCKQQLAVDASAAGTKIECPSCGHAITVPHADPSNIHLLNVMSTSAASREEKHFSVPVHDAPSEILIAQPPPKDEIAAEGARTLKIRCIKRTECVEVGKDRFEEVVSNFLRRVGEANVVSINTINYTHIDMGSRQILTDFGVLVVYRG